MRGALAAVLGGSVLALAAPAGWLALADERPGQYGGQAARTLATQAPAPALRPGRSASGAAAVATRSARLEDVLTPRDPPVEVRLAGRVAPVDPVGLAADRQVVVPADVRRAGWWSSGPAPGDAAGSAVLFGHADDREQGLGTFAVLRDLHPGAEVVVRTASGQDLAYEVVALERFPKAEVPMARLFDDDGAHRLVLISCGGAFDRERRTYADNVVVTAVPRR